MDGTPRLAGMRRGYRRGTLDAADLAPDWLTQFRRWLAEAVESALLVEANAMVLATADAAGRPSARTVLLKDVDERGFAFATNYGSRKGRDLALNPVAALAFSWVPIERQVLVEGTVERASREESVAYARTRPHRSQLAAWASPQSAVLPSREPLEARFAEAQARWPEGTEVPVPQGWGQLRLAPRSVEFWQGRPDRLHDRLRYRLDGSAWVVERLAP